MIVWQVDLSDTSVFLPRHNPVNCISKNLYVLFMLLIHDYSHHRVVMFTTNIEHLP